MKSPLRLHRFFGALLPAALLSAPAAHAQTIPVPDHIVLVVMENYGYPQIIGNTHAPYINGLLADTNCANFTGFYALTHPSQPNYLYLFSGSAQGNNDDGIPAGQPFTTPNLASELIGASKTFITYNEDMPSVGYNGGTYTASGANYVRKHNPVTNWMGSGTNQVPTSVNQPYTAFPHASNYASLPTVSYLMPNQDNDMHDGIYPSNIGVGDTWLANNIDSFKRWTLANNSLLIITFDEDEGLSGNRIPTLFYGPMVKGGSYSNHETLVNLLGTIEAMYSLGHAGAPFSSGITDTAITYCWRHGADTTGDTTHTTSVHVVAGSNSFKVSPNPATNSVNFQSTVVLNKEAVIFIVDATGRTMGKYVMQGTSLTVNTSSFPTGIYYYKIMNDSYILDEGKFIISGH